MFIANSHGADFFGADHHPIKTIQSIAEYLPGLMPANDAAPVVRLLTAACAGPTAAAPDEAAAYAERLKQAAGHRFMKPTLRSPVRLLADAAARAAFASEPWTLGPTAA